MRSERLDTHRANNLDQACLIHVTNKIKPWHPDFPDCRRKRLYQDLRAQIGGGMQSGGSGPTILETSA